MRRKRMSHYKLIVVLMLLAVAFTTGCKNTTGDGEGDAAATDAVYSRIIESGTIQAAYITYPPALMRDTATGEMSGIFVEVLEKAADNLGLRIEWTEEVGWGSQIEGLEADRYDIVGSPVWANPTRGRLTLMSRPVYYSGIGVYVRADDQRFTAIGSDGVQVFNPSSLNNDSVRIATVDGETGDLIARTDYPNAQRISLPQLTDISQKFLQVTSNHADVLFAEPYYGQEYLRANPGSVRNIAAAKPVRVFGNCYMFRRGEPQLQHMLNVAIEDLQNSGFVDQVIGRYEPVPGTFYRVARPFQVAQ